MTTEELLDKMIDGAIESYKQVMGEAAWNALTEEQKGEAVHIIVMDTTRAMLKAFEEAES